MLTSFPNSLGRRGPPGPPPPPAAASRAPRRGCLHLGLQPRPKPLLPLTPASFSDEKLLTTRLTHLFSSPGSKRRRKWGKGMGGRLLR